MMWFILEDEEVLGPFDNDSVKQSADSALVWGPGLKSWSSKAEWNKILINNPDVQKFSLKSLKAEEEVQVEEMTIVQSQEAQPQKAKEDLWYYACNKEKFGPFKEGELIQMLKMLSFSSQVYVWKKGLDNWAKLEDFPDLVTKLTNFAA